LNVDVGRPGPRRVKKKVGRDDLQMMQASMRSPKKTAAKTKTKATTRAEVTTDASSGKGRVGVDEELREERRHLLERELVLAQDKARMWGAMAEAISKQIRELSK
jgi:hypothetical protein